MTFLSPAKLNLGLKVVGKRADGYHLIKSVFCLIDLFDEIQIQITHNGKISLIEHNQAWPYNTDLSYRAAKLLQESSGTKFGANIKINKTIPSGGGMGGGSSNAATILCVLNNLWQLGLSNEKLMELGRKLGADIPFFIHGKNALASNIGDVFTDIELPEQYFVLICPKFHLNTAKVFQNFEYVEQNINIDTNYLLETLENDLLESAMKLKPALNSILKQLEFFGKVAMTGSGSSLYLRFNEGISAKKIAKKIAEINQNKYNTYLVKSLAVSPISKHNF
jgi:4-diphosphocytidyl-2-C-methyl-D-erythritol kinase